MNLGAVSNTIAKITNKFTLSLKIVSKYQPKNIAFYLKLVSPKFV